MKTPYYSNNQFIDQGVGNAAAAMVTDSIEDVAAALYSPGLINAGDVSLSYTGTNVVNVSAPLPFRVLFGSGVLASANGTVNGQQSSNASVDFSSVIPTSGTVTAYMVASASTVQQGAYQVVGPPVGHPDYNANFNPYTAYNETQDTLLFTATTTVPDNVTYMEVCRVTLTAGQTQITAANVSTAYQVLAAPTGGTRTVQGNETVTGELIVGGAATVGGNLADAFPSGTTIVFVQSAAPPGWTQNTSLNDQVLRVVSSSGGGTGGNWTLSGLTIGGTAITVAQMPSHTHGVSDPGHVHGTQNYLLPNYSAQGGGGAVEISKSYGSGTYSATTGISIDDTGSGDTHTHSISSDGSWRPAYVNAIVCSKD